MTDDDPGTIPTCVDVILFLLCAYLAGTALAWAVLP